MTKAAGHGLEVSVVIPTFERPVELRRCLEGFARQTAAPEQFEVVVIDDGSTADIEQVVAPFRERFRLHFERCNHAGVSVARNLGVARSSAPLVTLYDDDLEPLPELIERCIQFHERNPGDRQVELLYFTPDLAMAEWPVVRWAFEDLYPFPGGAAVFRGWHYFWGGSITCKRTLFRDLSFDAEFLAVEDAEFGVRANERGGLQIHFEPRATGRFIRPLGVMEICRRQYRMAYYRYALARRHGIEFGHPVYQRPEEFVIGDWPAYRAMLEAAKGQETAMLPDASPRFKLLCGMWTKAEYHALASGWLAARAGSPASGI
jgi:glycosyltransferase involved in cell wall biosynthesis